MAAPPPAPPPSPRRLDLSQPAQPPSSFPSSSPTTTTDSASTGSLPRRSTHAAPAARKRFSLDLPLLRRRLSPRPAAGHPGHDNDEHPIGHQARVLYAVITGVVPEPAPTRPRLRVLSLSASTSSGARRRKAQAATSAVPRSLSSSSIAGPELQQAHAQGVRARKHQEEEHREHGSTGQECRAVPHVKPKALKKLKADLVKADKARAIVADLKRLEVPLDELPAPASSLDLSREEPTCASSPRRKVVRAYCLSSVVDDAAAPPWAASSSSLPSPPSPPRTDPTLRLVTFGTDLPLLSPGALGGLAGAKSGAFELLADLSGALVEKSGAHEGVYGLPQDRVSVLIYWWGFEIALPPPAIRTLSSVASVQSSFFTFLQAFTLAGGAPELAPFVRYISSYCDMEWQAIKAQNRGKGVVLAATWLLPVALVPRPWDFPLRPPSSTLGRPL
ncbi:hypothetical protein JCM8208_004551 [Rhodotorula glutinis]